jgi:hypothetical protein
MTTQAAVAGKSALTAQGTVSVTLTKPHDPDIFYQTRSGLYVHGGFRTRVVRKADLVESAAPLTLRKFVFARSASDLDIEAGLGENHIFTEAEACWVIAEMIGKQEGGTAGDLGNTGKANLFYTPSCVVRVRWDAVDRDWYVNTWTAGDRDWRAGSSAFSRN